MSFQAKNTDEGSNYETPNTVSYNSSGYFRAEKSAPLQSTVSNAPKGSKRKVLIPSYGGSPFPAADRSSGSYATVANSY